jgi:cell division protein FtsW (lipid II flippase)
MRRGLPLLLLVAPALGLSALGVVMVGSTTARLGAINFGDPRHFVFRQVVALILAAAVALVVALAGARRVMRAAPVVFAVALLAALAVFVPGVGVRAAGARRWLHLGRISLGPAPLLTLAVGLIVSAWGRRSLAARDGLGATRAGALQARLALVLALLAVLALIAEPDFSAAGIALVVGVVALGGLGIEGRRLVPAALALALALALVASQFGYVGGRLHGFLAPQLDRRGKGFEVLALARATAGATGSGVGLGRGEARRHLSSPASDYVFSVVTEETGKRGAAAVIAAWLCVAGAALLAARDRRDRRLRAAALSSGMAMIAPAALHIAVCTGLCPIIGVTMPFVSYDPAATVAAGAELGLIASIILSSHLSSQPSKSSDP